MDDPFSNSGLSSASPPPLFPRVAFVTAGDVWHLCITLLLEFLGGVGQLRVPPKRSGLVALAFVFFEVMGLCRRNPSVSGTLHALLELHVP
jgi:hypothetical protein